jgi:hypothetical protein
MEEESRLDKFVLKDVELLNNEEEDSNREEESELQEKGKVKQHRDITTGRLTAVLKNGHQVGIVRLSHPDIIRGIDFKLKANESLVAEQAKKYILLGNIEEGVETIKEQFEEGSFEVQLVEQLRSIFQVYGKDVFLLNEQKDAEGKLVHQGLDITQIGNRADFDHGPVFVVAESRKDELIALFENPPSTSALMVGGSYDIEPFNRLGDEGMTIKFRHQDTHGRDVITEMRFLYSQEKKKDKNNEEIKK